MRLLRAARKESRRPTPAQVVLAGLTNRSWLDLGRVYRAGGGRLFDLAAVHPFSRRVTNVLKIVRLVRATMRRYGDGASRCCCPRCRGPRPRAFDVQLRLGDDRGRAGRAPDARPSGSPRAAQGARIAAVYWYTWLSPAIGGRDSFDYAGLRRLDGAGRPVSKPALAAFRLVARRLERAGGR